MFAEKWIRSALGTTTPRELDRLVAAYHKQGRFTGAVLVARGGKVLLRKGYGYAEQEGDWAANTAQTTFRIGSMTKPFTAVVIMQLMQEGRLGLDAPIVRYLPDFPNGERITVRHLLANRSGIEDYIGLPAYEQMQTQRVTREQIIALFRDLPLRFEPGTDYGYSNSNWALLAVIIERVSGQSFAEVVTRRILQPAGMNDSGLDWRGAKRRSMGYLDTGAGIQPSAVLDSSSMLGGGDLHATADDLLRFDRALHSGVLLPMSVLTQMWAEVTAYGDIAYGLGFERHTLHGHVAVGHSGGMPGFVSNYLHFIDDDTTLIILSNLGSAAWEVISEGLVAILYGAPYALPGVREFVAVPADVLMNYVGDYQMEYFGRTAILSFTVDGGKLIMKTHGLPPAVLSAMSDTRFFGRSKGEVELTFVTEQDKRVNRIDIMWGGYKLFAERSVEVI
jgi:CubicO group peptidase (beta-lactamase class C family)